MTRSTTFTPLAHRAFLLILLGSLLSNFGNAIQSVGAAWQLTIIHQPADVIALVQTATNLPIMLLALPAGAWADMFDKRAIMLLAQTGMFAMSLLLVALAFAGMTPPVAIIGLTALLPPAWPASTPRCRPRSVASSRAPSWPRQWRSTSSRSTSRAASGRRSAGRSSRSAVRAAHSSPMR